MGTSNTKPISNKSEVATKAKLDDTLRIKDLEEQLKEYKEINRGLRDYLHIIDNDMNEGGKAYIISQQLIDICMPYEYKIGKKSQEYKDLIMQAKGKLAMEIEEVILKHVEVLSEELKEFLDRDDIKAQIQAPQANEINLGE